VAAIDGIDRSRGTRECAEMSQRSIHLVFKLGTACWILRVILTAGFDEILDGGLKKARRHSLRSRFLTSPHE
jgi:hypothetical protein